MSDVDRSLHNLHRIHELDPIPIFLLVYDDGVTNDPIEETENRERAYKSLNGVGGFRTQVVSCGKLRAARTKRLAL